MGLPLALNDVVFKFFLKAVGKVFRLRRLPSLEGAWPAVACGMATRAICAMTPSGPAAAVLLYQVLALRSVSFQGLPGVLVNESGRLRA